MVAGGAEEGLAFHSTNGLIQDPMAVYRAAKLTNVWADEEKKIFREKYDPQKYQHTDMFSASVIRIYTLSQNHIHVVN